jgi:hypothetical protein
MRHGILLTSLKDERQSIANGFSRSNTQVMAKLNALKEDWLPRVTVKNMVLTTMRPSHLSFVFCQLDGYCYRILDWRAGGGYIYEATVVPGN